MRKSTTFKKMLKEPGIIVAPGVYDAVGARIAEQVGFSAVYMTGNGTVASKLGKPDIGLATMSDMVTWAGQIAASINVPLVCDADNGYGGLNNVGYAVQQFEAVGVSAIHIEDQGFPKKCGAMKGVSVIPAEEAAEKIKIAVKTRKDMIIIARTDSMSVYHDVDETINRLKMFEAAGADVVYAEMLESMDQLDMIVNSVKVPVMYDILECVGKDKIPTVKQLEDIGVKIVINCLSLMLYNCTNMFKLMQHYKNTGSIVEFYDEIMDLHKYEKLMGIDKESSIRDLLN